MTRTDPAGHVAVGLRRSEVLARLRESGRPLSVQQVAAQTGLHVNTVRFHLDGLVTDGLAERATEERVIPGRPRILYTVGAEVPRPRCFALLAEILTGLVTSLDGAGPAAIEAGRAWGRHLVDRPAPSQRVDADDATARLDRVLEAIGFQPEVRTGSDVICAIHLGLMQGALGELRAPLQATSLEPFVSPNLCVARLRAAPSDDGG